MVSPNDGRVMRSVPQAFLALAILGHGVGLFSPLVPALAQAPPPSSGGASAEVDPTGDGPQRTRLKLPEARLADTVLTTPEAISNVHRALYNMNFSVPPDGSSVTRQLRFAILRWQEQTNQPQTGDLNQVGYDRLRRVRPSKFWGAIAHSWTGASFAVWLQPDRNTAEQAALAKCQSGTAEPCRVLTFINSRCGVVFNARPPGASSGSSFAGWAEDVPSARAQALERCQRTAKVPESCKELQAVCADGGHLR